MFYSYVLQNENALIFLLLFILFHALQILHAFRTAKAQRYMTVKVESSIRLV